MRERDARVLLNPATCLARPADGSAPFKILIRMRALLRRRDRCPTRARAGGKGARQQTEAKAAPAIRDRRSGVSHLIRRDCVIFGRVPVSLSLSRTR